MKGKQLAVVLVLLVALGGIALFLRHRNAASWSDTATGSNEKILAFPLNDVTQLTIKTGEAELDLRKKDDVWRVAARADYPADFEKVATLIRKLWELRAVQNVQAGPSQLGRLELTAPGNGANSGTLIDLKGKDGKRLAALLLGKKLLSQSADLPGGGRLAAGRYVMAPDHPERVFLISETFDNAQTKPEPWLDHKFIKVENARSLALAGNTPAMNWKISRADAKAPWTLTDAKPGEELDHAKASSVTNYLANPNFIDVLSPDVPPAETGLDKPSTLTVETFDVFTYELRIGKLMGENYPVLVSVKGDLPKERTPEANEKPEEKTTRDQQFQTKQKELGEKLAHEEKLAGRPYLIAKSTVEQLLKERSALLQPPPTPSPSPSPAASASGKPRPTPSPSPPRRR